MQKSITIYKQKTWNPTLQHFHLSDRDKHSALLTVALSNTYTKKQLIVGQSRNNNVWSEACRQSRQSFLLWRDARRPREERMSQRLSSSDPSGRREGQKLLGVEKIYITCRKHIWFFFFFQEVKKAVQLTDSRWFSSGFKLCNTLVSGHFCPQWTEYDIGLSAGQSSSLGKPITLAKVNTTAQQIKWISLFDFFFFFFRSQYLY